MTIAERCASCADYDFCTRAYGRFFIARAMGWREDWKPDDGTRHHVIGCRHWRPGDKEQRND